uniref:Uncharacterized protein n=1 Tax=Anguilla anguilla TaxID=7936 RepID=A0A0E9TUA0_ANGAN
MAPCTILHWRSPVRYQWGPCTRTASSLSGRVWIKNPVHPDASIPAKERKCDTLTQV